MSPFVFDTNELPRELDDHSRFKAWHDFYAEFISTFDAKYFSDRPFSVRMECAQIGELRIAQYQGTMRYMERTARHIAVTPEDSFYIGINAGTTPLIHTQKGREAALDRGSSVLGTNTENATLAYTDNGSWLLLVIPQKHMLELTSGAEDLVNRTLHPETAVMRHLRRYLEMLLTPGGIEDDPQLIINISNTLTDLAALVVGDGRDAVDIARMRGLPAARLREILSVLNVQFSDPSFSPERAAESIGLSPRYIQHLLHESGISFTQRVLELRLQKARTMLADPKSDRLKVSDIALSCGFNEVSYFNRCFRRRFGASPTQYRGANGG